MSARVTVPARVGLVGCGVISREYVGNGAMFDAFEIVACADLEPTRRVSLAEEYTLRAMDPDELLTDRRSTSSSI